MSGVVIAAPPGYVGANALAISTMIANDTQTVEFEKLPASTNAQPALFSSPAPASNVIPFQQKQPSARPQPSATFRTPLQDPAPPAPARKTHARKLTPPVEQGTLDFIPAAPAKNRRLKTDVDAQIFCEQPVATPTHRFVAACVDAGLILVGFGVLVLAFQLMGGSFGEGKIFWLGLGGALTTVSLFYGLLWAIVGRETAGMSFTDLQLITFDGFPVDGRSRAARVASTWLSFCSGGLGLVWALADEETLTWQDHISKTFPTIRETSGSFVRQG